MVVCLLVTESHFVSASPGGSPESHRGLSSYHVSPQVVFVSVAKNLVVVCRSDTGLEHGPALACISLLEAGVESLDRMCVITKLLFAVECAPRLCIHFPLTRYLR